jgi:predicted ATP-binding protein involved in virulence
MKINNLTLINYRRFEHQSFIFNDHFTAIIGNNATGKTQVLQAIVTLFSQYQFKMLSIKLSHAKSGEMEANAEITTADVHHKSQVFDNKNGSHQVRMEYVYPSIISATVNDKEYVFCRRDDAADENNVRSSFFDRLAQDNLRKIRKQENVTLPILAYYGTRRLWNKKNRIADKIPSRTDGYRWSLDSFVDFDELKDWFKDQELIQLQKGTNEPVLKVMRKALAQMIPGCDNVFYDFELKTIAFRFRDDAAMPFEEPILQFEDLSDGYRMVFTLVFDIVRQMIMLNPHLGDEVLQDTDGIILIDELDLSLHPKWQRIVVDGLRKTFPKAQFVVTTHSPFIIQSLTAAEVIDLSECKGTVIEEHWTEIKKQACKSSLPAIEKTSNIIAAEQLGHAWPQAKNSEKIGKSIEDITEAVMGVEVPQRSARLQKMYDVAKEYYTKLEQLKGGTSAEIQRLEKELEKLSAPYSDNVAYHAFLEMERLAALQEHKEAQR